MYSSSYRVVRGGAISIHPHPELETFPDHVHSGGDKDAKESAPIDLQGVLEVLESEMKV